MQRLHVHQVDSSPAPRHGLGSRILELAAPYLGPCVLGVGAGIGQIGPIAEACERLLLVESNPFSVGKLKRQFAASTNVRVVPGELGNPLHASRWRQERPDTALCVNLLEHLERDTVALREIAAAIVPGGHAVVIAPACEALYNELDEREGRYRRYSPDELARKMLSAGLEVVHAELFGKLDAIDWAVSGYFGVRLSGWRPVAWLERWRPAARLFDKILPVPAACLAMIGKKPAHVRQRRAA
jgi:SAM-dependent methyltransferase